MVGFNRRFAPLLTELKDQFGAPGPARSTRYLVNAGRLEAGSWYANEELEGSRFTGEGGHFIDTLSWWAGSLPQSGLRRARADRRRRVRPRPVRRTGRPARSATSPAATRASPRRPWTPRAAAGARGWTTSSGPRSGPGARAPSSRARAAVIDKGQRRQVEAFVAAVPDRRADADLARLAGRHHAGHDRGRREPGQRPSGAGVSVTGGRQAGLVRPPGGGGCRPPRWRGGPAIRRSGWPGQRRQVRPGQPATALPPGAARVHRRAACRAPRRWCPSRPGTRYSAAAEALLAGEWDVLGVDRTDLAAPDWFRRPGHRPALRPGPVRVPDQPPRSAERDRQHQAGLGAVPAPPPDPARRRLVPEPRRGLRGPGRRPAAVLVAAEPVPVRRALDQRHRARGPADQPGLDPAAAERLAGGRRTCSSAIRLALPQIHWHQQYLAAFRSRGSSANNHVIAEAAGQLVASCAFPWFTESAALAAGRRRAADGASWRTTLPAAA